MTKSPGTEIQCIINKRSELLEERYSECLRGWPPIAQVALSERERAFLQP